MKPLVVLTMSALVIGLLSYAMGVSFGVGAMAVAMVTGFVELVGALLLRAGFVKPGGRWGDSSLAQAMSGLGILLWVFTEHTVVLVLGTLLLLGSLYVESRARRSRKPLHSIQHDTQSTV